MNDIKLETDRLILRRLQTSDLDDYTALETHPAMGAFRSRGPMSEEEAEAFISFQSSVEVGTERGWLHLGVERKANPGIIGTVCIKVINKQWGHAEIGWFLHPDHQGRGIATEASASLIDFAFDHLDMHRLTATCDVLNTRSYMLMERLGMRREAEFKETVFFNDVWHDQYGYAILKHERAI